MEIDATQVLDLGYDDEYEEVNEKKEIGKLKTANHKLLPEKEFPIYEGINIIGRDDRSDIPIKVQALSKKHACIEVSGDSCLIYDFNSRNKTKKGKIILKPLVRYELNDGDELTFADVTTNFSICNNEDNDATGSMTDCGSETGSESMIPEDGEENIGIPTDNTENQIQEERMKDSEEVQHKSDDEEQVSEEVRHKSDDEKQDSEEVRHKSDDEKQDSEEARHKSDNEEQDSEEARHKSDDEKQDSEEVRHKRDDEEQNSEEVQHKSGDKQVYNIQKVAQHESDLNVSCVSNGSNSILLPTQIDTKDSLYKKKTKHAEENSKEEVEDLYAAETDTESEGEENTPTEATPVTIIKQTPGFGLSQRMQKTIVDNVPESPNDLYAKSKSLLSECPECPAADDSVDLVVKNSDIFSDNLDPSTIPIGKFLDKKREGSDSSTDADQYASTVPIEDSFEKSSHSLEKNSEIETVNISTQDQLNDCETGSKRRRGTIERVLNQLADTVPVEENSSPQKDDDMDDEEIVGTYVFDDYDYEGEDEKSCDEDDEDNEETTDEVINPTEEDVIKKCHDEKMHTDDSQEIPFTDAPIKKCITSTQLLESFQSFGTPVSSINNTQNVCSSAEGKTNAFDKVISDSDEEATQPYETSSPYKHTSPDKHAFKVPLAPLANSEKSGSLPGGSGKSLQFYDAVDAGTHMSSSDDDVPKNVNYVNNSEDDFDNMATQAYNPPEDHGIDNQAETQAYTACDDFDGATQMYNVDVNAPTQDYISNAPTQAYIEDLDTQAYIDNAATQAYVQDDIENGNNIETQGYALDVKLNESDVSESDLATQAYVSDRLNESDLATQAYVSDKLNESDLATQAYGLNDEDFHNKSPEKSTSENPTESSMLPFTLLNEEATEKNSCVKNTRSPKKKKSVKFEEEEEEDEELHVVKVRRNIQTKKGKTAAKNSKTELNVNKKSKRNAKYTIDSEDNNIIAPKNSQTEININKKSKQNAKSSNDLQGNDITDTVKSTEAMHSKIGDENVVIQNPPTVKRGRPKKPTKRLQTETSTIENRRPKRNAKNSLEPPSNDGMSAETVKNESKTLHDNLSDKQEHENDIQEIEPQSLVKGCTPSEIIVGSKRRGRKAKSSTEPQSNDIPDAINSNLSHKNEKEIQEAEHPPTVKIGRINTTKKLQTETSKIKSKHSSKNSDPQDIDDIHANVVKDKRDLSNKHEQEADILEETEQLPVGKRKKGRGAAKAVQTDTNVIVGSKRNLLAKCEQEADIIEETEQLPVGKRRKGRGVTKTVQTDKNVIIGNRRNLSDKCEQEADIIEETEQLSVGRGRKGRGAAKISQTGTDVIQQEANIIEETEQLPVGKRRKGRAAARKSQTDTDVIIEGKHDLSDEHEQEADIIEETEQLPVGKRRKGRGAAKNLPTDTDVIAVSKRNAKNSVTGKNKRLIINSLTDNLDQESDSTENTKHPSLDKTKEKKGSNVERRQSALMKPRIVFTGISDKAVEKIVTDLGGEVVDSVANATHLVTDKVRRTVKFLCAVAKGIPVVDPEWLKSAKLSSLFTSYKNHLLLDAPAEKQYKFQLKRSTQKAGEISMLKDYKVYVTKNVKPEPKNMKEMVECSGGKYLTKPPRTASDDVIIISCSEDQKESQKLTDQGFKVCSNELLLTGILRQELNIEQFSIVNEAELNTSQEVELSSKRKRTSSNTTAARKRKR